MGVPVLEFNGSGEAHYDPFTNPSVLVHGYSFAQRSLP